MALLLCGLLILLWVAWWFVLTINAPEAPSSQTGQITALRIRQSGSAIFVRPIEALISTLLAVSAFVGPAAYLIVYPFAGAGPANHEHEKGGWLPIRPFELRADPEDQDSAVSSVAASGFGPLSWPFAATLRSTSSITAIVAASP